MARTMKRTQMREGVGFGMRLSETIIIAALGIGILLAIRYYFVIYRNSPGFALTQYLNGVNSGNINQQYEWIDPADKAAWFPTAGAYEKAARQSRGYTSRITGVTQMPPKINPKKPQIAEIDTITTLTAPTHGRELYQVADKKDYKNTFWLHKDSEGRWRVVLSQSMPSMEMLAAEPNPPVDSFN